MMQTHGKGLAKTLALFLHFTSTYIVPKWRWIYRSFCRYKRFFNTRDFPWLHAAVLNLHRFSRFYYSEISCPFQPHINKYSQSLEFQGTIEKFYITESSDLTRIIEIMIVSEGGYNSNYREITNFYFQNEKPGQKLACTIISIKILITISKKKGRGKNWV